MHYITSLNTISCAFTPLWPFVCLGIFFSGKKFVCPPFPTFRCRATPLVLLVHIKQKLKCTSVIMHSPSYLSICRLSLHPFESHSFCRPSRICIFDFLSRRYIIIPHKIKKYDGLEQSRGGKTYRRVFLQTSCLPVVSHGTALRRLVLWRHSACFERQVSLTKN